LIIVPRVSSERREYIPMGFLDKKTIIVDSAQAVYDAESWVFGVLTSRMHMTWVRAVAGRLKTDYRYSAEICYNTFPFPNINENQKKKIEMHVDEILMEREKHSEKTMAELYDPDKMPEGLRRAHHDLDIAIELCYRQQPFDSDEKRLEYLFKMYEIMTDPTKKDGVEQLCLI
ncbi:MAG: type IIL restriction-modification enzyme MmeI, partial [bacterium]